MMYGSASAQGFSSLPVVALLQVMVNPPTILAFRCIQASVAYRTSTELVETSRDMCRKGDTFFGKRVVATDGPLWLFNESKNLFLPLVRPENKTEMFKEVHYRCAFAGHVQARSTPEFSNTCEAWVSEGQSISALPALEHPGWLIEAGSELYYPMKNQIGAALFTSKAVKATGTATGDVEQGRAVPARARAVPARPRAARAAQTPAADDPSCEQVATAVSICIPLVGRVTCCVSSANNKEGSNKRKWGNIACGVATASFVGALVLNFVVFPRTF